MLSGFYLTIMTGQFSTDPVPREVVESLTSAQVNISSGQASGFQLTFTTGKNSILTTQLIPGGFFDPLKRVILVVTVNGVATVLMDGIITRQEVTPSNDPGQSTLTITGGDLTAVMDLIDFSGIPYPALPAEARVALICAKYALYGIVPLVIPGVLIDVPIPIERIPVQQGTDLRYVNYLADEVGYVFYITPGPKPGRAVAYWGPEVRTGTPQSALNVNWDGQTNVESLNFSYDGLSKRQLVVFIQTPFTKIPIPIPVPDVNPLTPPLAQKSVPPLKIEQLRDTAKLTPIQAAALGLARVAQSNDVISGSGSLDVLRYGRLLRARELVGVRGAGLAYDGLYFVKSVSHNIKRGEYKQNFTLVRDGLLPKQETVSP
jgi:hypothetical protein